MSLLGRLLGVSPEIDPGVLARAALEHEAELRASPENPETPISEPSDWLVSAVAGEPVAGVYVTPETAMRVSAVYACVRILAGTMGSLPLQMFERLERGRKRITDHDAVELLSVPNDNQTGCVFRESMHAGLELTGNACAVIERAGSGRPLRLVQVTAPVTMRLIRGRLFYDLEVDGWRDTLPAADVLHVPHLSLDGFSGISPIGQARLALGTAISAEQYAADILGNTAVPSGALQSERQIDGDVKAKIRASWKQLYAGRNRGQVAILDEGLKWQQITLSPADLQTLEIMKAKISDVARIFGVPLWLLAETEKSTSWGSGIEQQGVAMITYSLTPRLTKWEAELERKLLTPAERRAGLYFRFNVEGLLRGDSKSRMDYLTRGIASRIFNPNEAREVLDMNPYEGGDEFHVPLNMAAPENAEPKKDDEPADEPEADEENEQ